MINETNITTEMNVVPVCPVQKTIATSQGKLSYRSGGKGEKIIFLHGLLGSAKAWAFQFFALSPAYNVIAWDAPGYALSDLVNAEIDNYVQALHELIQASGNDQVSIVGHSMGGTVASRYVAKHPENVKCLILSCTHPGYGDPETAPASEKLEKRMQELAEIGSEAYGWNRAHDLLPFPDIPQTVLAYAATIAAETRPDGLRRASRMLQLADNRSLLSQIRVPTLVLTGEKDKVVSPQLKSDLLTRVPFTKHIEMPGLGHAPYFQAPEYYNALIQDFISHY